MFLFEVRSKSGFFGRYSNLEKAREVQKWLRKKGIEALLFSKYIKKRKPAISQ